MITDNSSKTSFAGSMGAREQDMLLKHRSTYPFCRLPGNYYSRLLNRSRHRRKVLLSFEKRDGHQIVSADCESY